MKKSRLTKAAAESAAAATEAGRNIWDDAVERAAETHDLAGAIATTETDHRDRPTVPVVINSVTLS